MQYTSEICINDKSIRHGSTRSDKNSGAQTTTRHYFGMINQDNVESFVSKCVHSVLRSACHSDGYQLTSIAFENCFESDEYIVSVWCYQCTEHYSTDAPLLVHVSQVCSKAKDSGQASLFLGKGQWLSFDDYGKNHQRSTAQAQNLIQN